MTRDSLPREARYASKKLETIESFLRFAGGGPPPQWPMGVYLEVSNVCDLRCAMCTTFSGLYPERSVALKRTQRGFLDPNLVERSLTSVLQHALQVHCFGYGEPTIHPEFESFIDHISTFEVMIDFFTNGMHLTEAFAEFLVERGIYKVTVSFSGSSKDEYENVYLGGEFERVLGGIRNLHEAKVRHGASYPHIHINSIGFEHHVNQLPRFVELMADHGVNEISVKPLVTVPHIPDLFGHASVFRPNIEGILLKKAQEVAKHRGVSLSTSAYEATVVSSYEEWISKKRLDPKNFVPLRELKKRSKQVVPVRPDPNDTTPPVPSLMGSSPEAIAAQLGFEELPKVHREFVCFEPFKTMYVARDGGVLPCCFSKFEHRFGDLTADTGEAIWNGTPYQTIREGILEGRYPMQGCQDCVKNRSAPFDHYAEIQVGTYQNWFSTRFAGNLSRHWYGFLSGLGTNHMIAERRLPDPPADLAREVDQCGSSAAMIGELNALLRAASTPDEGHGIIRGYIDGIADGNLTGWVWSGLYPQERLTVVLEIEREIVATARCDLFRGDLVHAGIGDGYYAFRVVIPPEHRDGQWHLVRARVRGTAYYLRQEERLFRL